MSASAPPLPSLLNRPRSRLSAFVVGSVAFHVAIVAAAVWLSTAERAPKLDLDQKPVKATLVRLGKPRDPSMLPRKEPKAPPPPKEVKAPEPPPTQPAPPAPAPTTPTVPIPAAATQAPAPAPKAGEAKGVDRKKDLFAAFDRTAKEFEEPEELEGAEDGDPDGDSAIQEGERYYGMLTAQIKRNYSLPDTLSDEERLRLKALIRIRIGTAGQLIAADLVKGSENPLFDNAVLAAVKRTAPFSPPPAHLNELLGGRGVAMEFGP